ncbi:MAG: molybdopterin-dependent oxidoreductase [Gammaproteobacteria bacterium]|nr:molybdopterin-dependent oxidoreductase [Gammaproteobacteria bacterium]
MGLKNINRRGFLKLMGWSGVGATVAGCDMPTTVTLEEGKETVTSYLVPEEYAIPGIGVWYSSTCRQCPAGCGLHGRVREGRILKLEGNPDSPINAGKLCQMGQAGLQGHYNPDRLRTPKVRKDGKLVDITWAEALDLIDQHVGASSGLNGARFAWVSDSVSGHQAMLIDNLMSALGSKNLFIHEVVNSEVARSVNQAVLGDATPRYQIGKAHAILSIGNDFLGTGDSPVHASTEYTEFRSSPRGVLGVVEPKMTLTGANADLWMAIRPGTEGVFALSVANVLATKHKMAIDMLPKAIQTAIMKRNLNEDARLTGVSGNHVIRVAKWLSSNPGRSIVMVGGTAEGQVNGYQNGVAAMVLNVMLGNVGKTIVASHEFPFPQLEHRAGGTAGLLDFVKAIDNGGLDVAFFSGANPVYTAPAALGLKDKLASIPFKVSFTQFDDETSQLADLVLPILSPMEDWATIVPKVQGEEAVISMQQPVMEPLYADTRGLGDIVLDLLKKRDGATYGNYDSYYAYLSQAFASFPANMAADGKAVTWNDALAKGVIAVKTGEKQLKAKLDQVAVALPEENAEYPLTLIPTPRLGLWDGRHANIPWLQEAPDQISKVVWDSWAEIHPNLAKQLGVETGDAIKITSAQGAIDVKVYVFKGIHPDAIAVPLGQGHKGYGRYADGRGVNPLEILDTATVDGTNELALYSTRVKVEKARNKDTLVMMGDHDVQMGRKMVSTVTPDVFELTGGEA